MAAAEQQCVRLRSLVQDCLAKHMYDSAAFFADKLVTLSQRAPADIYLLAQVAAPALPRCRGWWQPICPKPCSQSICMSLVFSFICGLCASSPSFTGPATAPV